MNTVNPRVAALFDVAVELESAEERANYLTRECPDRQVRAEVESLLAAHENPDTVFAQKTVRMEPSAEAVGTLIGPYKLLEAIGEGGFGTVWLAEQKVPVRRKVALKIIKLGMDTKQVVARFEAERQALALMDHPNIAKVFDAGATETGRPYFAMELVRGIPMTKFCDDHKLSTRERLELFIKVCQAVQHAHQKGIIHRDLKPSNVLVTLHDGVPVPKVIDFGIAKATHQELTDKTIHTQLHQFVGTPAYVSPEQAEMSGLDIDTRSDIYSLGVLLYELLTGTTPFDARELIAAGLEAMRRTIREQDPMRPSARLSTLGMEAATELGKRRQEKLPTLIGLVRGDLDWIVMKCMEKDRTRRYETANGIAADLKRHLGYEPVTARPPSAAYRLQRFVRRNRTAVSAGAAAILLLVVAAVGTSIGFVRAERTARQLEQNLYVNRIALAHRELTGDPPNIHEAEKLLEACPAAFRGWEWHYLKRQWLEDPRVLVDPSGRGFSSIALSGNATLIATAGNDGYVRIWDSERKLLNSIPAHPNGFVVSVVFDPKHPNRLVSAGSDRLIKVWDWRNGTMVHSWPLHFSFEQGLAYSVAFSPDGERIAGSTADDTIQVWSAVSGEELSSYSGHDEAAAFSLAFSPDGRELAGGCSDGFVRVWNTSGSQTPHRSLGPFELPVACVAYNASGGKLGAASFDGSVRVWDRDSGKELLHFPAHRTYAVGLSFTPDGRRLATAGHDGSVKLWDARSGQQILALRDFTNEARCVQFTHDGLVLFGASLDGTVRVWNATPLRGTEGKGLHTILVPTLGLGGGGMEVSRDGSMLLAGAGARLSAHPAVVPLYIWDTASGSESEMITGSGFLFSLSLSPDGRFLATSGDSTEEFTAKVWDMQTRKAVFTTEGVPGKGMLFSLSYSPDGKYLVAGGHQGKLIVWDAKTGRAIGIVGEHERGRTIFHLTFSPNGRYLASTSQDGNVRVWDATQLDQAHQPVAEFRAATPDYTDSLAFSPDGSRLVTARDDNTAVIWDVGTGRELLVLKSERKHGYRAIAYSADGKWIASGGSDSSVKLWNAATGELARTFAGHRGDVVRLRFAGTASGLRLISASRDGTLKVWDPSTATPE